MAFLFSPHFQAVNASGVPMAGATLGFYRAATTTKINIYQNSQATTPLANPVTADASGNFPAIFLTTLDNYKFILKDGSGVTVQTVDRIPVGGQVDPESFTEYVDSAGPRGWSKVRVVNTDFDAGGAGSFGDLTLGAASGDTFTSLQAFTDGGSEAGELRLNPSGGAVDIGGGDQITMSGPVDMDDLLSVEPPALAELDPKGFYVGVFPTASGSQEGDYFMNRIEGHFKRTQVGEGLEGNPGSGLVNLLHVGLGVGGPNYSTLSAAAIASGLVQLEPDTNVGDKLGINSGVYTAFSTLSRLYGGSTGATIDDGGYAAQLCGFETDVFILGDGDTPIRLGFNSWSGGSKQASNIDAAYAIGVRGGEVDTGVPVAPWFDGMIVYTGSGGNQPLDPAGSLIRADEALTLANILNLENFNITGDIIKAVNARLTGDGLLTLGTDTTNGAIAIKGDAADNIEALTLAYEGVSKWQIGGTATSFYLTKAGEGVPALGIDFANNRLKALNGLVADTIFDVNGNEVLYFAATASAVNQISISNAATGAYPVIAPMGDDASIGLNFRTKGTADFNFLATSAQASRIKLYEDSDNGSNSVAITVAASVASDFVLTVPSATDTLVGRATTDTLTNKTLTGNTAVNLVSGSGTLTLNTTGTVTLPNATDTLVGKATTDTLSNKTMATGTLYALAGSVTPTNNGEMMIQSTSNVSLTFKYKGSDGVVRSGSIALS